MALLSWLQEVVLFIRKGEQFQGFVGTSSLRRIDQSESRGDDDILNWQSFTKATVFTKVTEKFGKIDLLELLAILEMI